MHKVWFLTSGTSHTQTVLRTERIKQVLTLRSGKVQAAYKDETC